MPTVLHRLSRWADSDPEAVAQRFKNHGQWAPITAREFSDRVYWLALFLESRGMTKDDCGCVLGYNSPEWVHVDLATQLVGARSAGLYPNSTAKDIHYILNHTECAFLAIQNKEYADRTRDVSKGGGPLPQRIRLVLAFDGGTDVHPKAVTYQQALAEGRKLAAAPGAKKLEDFLGALDPQLGAILIYTSGTTGNPKGALLSHDNLVFTSDLAVRYWKLPMGDGSLFSFLPLCHVAEKLQNIGVGISQRYMVTFSSKFDAVSKELPEVEPTLLLSVPRLWEKMMEGVESKINRSEGLKKKLALWALGVGARVADARFTGRMPNPLDLIQYRLADRIILSKIRKAMGLGQARMLASGAAALSPHVSKWFRCLGLEILEDFGQTESTGVICMTEAGVESAGTVGKPVPGIEVKIAEDGEILTRGRHVFKGYWKDPVATQATLEGGWLHTGDLGEVTDQGLIRIRGRKKEVLKTSGGKMVAPVPIEERLKAAPIISQVCIVGDGRKYLSALITLSEDALAELKKRDGSSLSGRLITDASVVNEVKKQVEDINQTLAGFEQIKRFSILAQEFSIANEEMTPTLKMKRSVIEKNYVVEIDSMYHSG